MSILRNASEDIAVVGRIKPASKTAGNAVTTDVVDMDVFPEALFLFNFGDYGAGNDGTVTVKLQASNDGTSFTNPVDVTDKALPVASFSGSAQDDAVGVIRVSGDELIIDGTHYRYVRGSVTPANQAMTLGAVVIGLRSRYSPASDYDIAAVTSIIA